MGRHSRQKGKRAEREIVRLAHSHGLDATRTWYTAQADDPHVRCCDVTVEDHAGQVKIAASGFKTVYDALEGVEIGFLRADQQPWLAVMTATRLFTLLAQVRAGKAR